MPENDFFDPQNGQNDNLECQKFVKFRAKISIGEVIYKPLELKIHSKLGHLRPKTIQTIQTIPKHFQNHFEK